MTFKDISSEVREHHNLVLIVLGLVVLYFSWDKYVNYAAQRDHDAAALSAAQLADAKTLNAQLATKVGDLESKLEQLTAAYSANLAASNARLAQMDRELALAKANVQNLSSPELATATQTELAVGTVAVAPNDNFLFSKNAVQETLRRLLQGKRDASALVEKTSLLNELTDVSVKQTETITGLHEQVKGLNDSLAKSEDNTLKQVASCHSDEAKKRSKWAKIAFIAGVVVGWLGHTALQK